MTEKFRIDWNDELKATEEVKAIISARYKNKTPLAFVHSYGCQQNVADGEKIKGILSLCGYDFCERVEDADIVIFNTCAVREHAEARVFGNVGALVHHKRRNPDMLIGLCGCMVQQERVTEKIKKSYPFVDIVFGPDMLPNLPQILLDKLTRGKRVFDIRSAEGEITEGIKTIRDNNIRAFVSVMSGCDNFCSYCIVPYVRGRERSRKSEEILKEIRELVGSGIKEIMLLGQNVNSYGKNLEEKINFSELLRRINAIEGDFRIRFMTSHPKDATKELIDTIRDLEKVCNQLHLPVQSGSDEILEKMNRRYTKEKYLELINYAKKEIPDISFSSDIIVGFPNETREDFLKTLELIEEVGYDMLFTFIYSPREGTVAAKMEDKTPKEEKSAYLRELIELQANISEERNKKRIGKIKRVLFDGLGKENGFISGRDEQNIIVEVQASEDLIGQFKNVEITSAQAFSLRGVIKEEE